ncbi:MAG: beta-lactamase family protein [Dysgonamonadaceae bacterium]|jgi:CubicO group peptidase (beta-lactamase class C family)|nr:beta-lactamase family protein [Dysgonamonadaceae bacterium]
MIALKKNSLITLVIIFSILIAAILAVYITGNGYIFKAVRKTWLKGHRTTHIDDYPDFDNHIIAAGIPQYWDFHPDYGHIQLTDTLRKELEDFQTIGFAIIKDGKLLYEEYWDDYSSESYTNSFSMAKTITTMLLGKALEQGFIRSLDEPLVDFIPEFSRDTFGCLATVGDLSAMTSGFDWTEEYYSPFNVMTQAYFGNNIEKQLLNRRFSQAPGGHFRYCSADTQLLAIVLKRATGKNLAQYLSEEFWQPMGMEHDALWSISGGIEKSFCCIHSNVRDFAKFGQLLLQDGKWNGKQLLDSAFVKRMITPNYRAFDQDEPKKYGYSIWIDEEHDPLFYGMMGHLGQRIIVVPDKSVVIVRLGKSKDTLHSGKGHLDVDTYYFVDEVMKII